MKRESHKSLTPLLRCWFGCNRLWVIGLAFMILPGKAFGCSICCTALADSILPPIELWVLLALTWFIASGVVRSLTGIRLPCQPGWVGSVLIAGGLLVLGAAMMGLAIALILFFPPVLGFAKTFGSRLSAASSSGIRAIRILGWGHLVGILFASVLLAQTHLLRTPEKFISKWGFNGSGQQQFQALRTEEPRSLDAYRYLVLHANDTAASAAAERIGEIGDPERDLPLLREALARLRKPGYFVSGIEAGLSQLESRQKGVLVHEPTNTRFILMATNSLSSTVDAAH